MNRGNAAKKSLDPIIIDENKDLIFDNEEDLFNHFQEDIGRLEEEYLRLRGDEDLDPAIILKYEKNLHVLLDDPDEVWEDSESLSGQTVYIYLREFAPEKGDDALYHVAMVYLTEDVPTFIYLHFPTRHFSVVEKYQRGEIVYDRIMENAPAGALDGDALLEGDELAVGLYEAMMTLRHDDDLDEKSFRDFADCREASIEEPDEIWRTTDSLGHVLVSFIREFPDEHEGKDLFYVVVTLEDAPSNSHALMFSFPSTDKNLIERYRHGENLQADEVVQEASH